MPEIECCGLDYERYALGEIAPAVGKKTGIETF
jgi:hypothetical protein